MANILRRAIRERRPFSPWLQVMEWEEMAALHQWFYRTRWAHPAPNLHRPAAGAVPVLPVGAAGRPNAVGNFYFDVTLSYRRLERPRRRTTAVRHVWYKSCVTAGNRCSTAKFAQRVNVAVELADAGVPVADAARMLVGRFRCSPRQALPLPGARDRRQDRGAGTDGCVHRQSACGTGGSGP
ncbi:hypothetical protein OG563_47395 [Nocardia vinacea]|uniref:Transposase n=1 Tax=Nocardia vinacea TaxID=96468 RepID=A0ABZ1YTG1_9NOCA|nr:hypothetical protein [Nocardia vinacea]